MQHSDTLPRGWSVRLAALLAGSAIVIGLLLTSGAGTAFAQSVAPASAAPSVAASAAPSAVASGAIGASSAPVASAGASGGVLGATGGGGASAPATSTLPADGGSGQASLLVPLLLLAGVFVAAVVVLAPRAARRR